MKLKKPEVPCPSCGGRSQSIASVQVEGVYDGVLFWICGKCDTAFHRWPVDDPLSSTAGGYGDLWNNGEQNRKEEAELRRSTDGGRDGDQEEADWLPSDWDHFWKPEQAVSEPRMLKMDLDLHPYAPPDYFAPGSVAETGVCTWHSAPCQHGPVRWAFRYTRGAGTERVAACDAGLEAAMLQGLIVGQTTTRPGGF